MKVKTVGILLLTFLMVGAVLVMAGTAVAQTGPNLLTNPGFEEGHHNQGGVAELTVPNGWRLHWLDGVEFLNSNGPAYRPESVVWNSQGGVPEGEEIFWKDGIYTLKVFKGWAPMYAALSQDVSGLEVGRKYRLVAPIFIDIVADYDGGKIPPKKLDSGFVRMGASPVGAQWRNAEQINYSGYWTAATVSPFYQSMPTFVWDFTATQESMTIWIEFGSKDPYPNNGFFMDRPGLYALEEFGSVGSSGGNSGGGDAAPAPAQRGPTATPQPTPTPRADGSIVHVVQPGDTFWAIAIQYAGAMGMTPEEALPAIQEQNNNPTFLNAGDELVIVPPQSEAAEPTAAATATAASGTEAITETVETDEGSALTLDGAESLTDTAQTETAAPAPESETNTAANAICVTTFADANGNGVYNRNDETLLSGAALTVRRGGETVASYVADGMSEEHCFQDLAADTYQIQFFPPADYRATTDDSWAVVVSGGVQVPVSFGAQYNPGQAVAEADTAATTTEGESVSEVASDEGTDVAAEMALASDDNVGSSVGMIVIGIAVFLVLLAVVGVVLLRRA